MPAYYYSSVAGTYTLTGAVNSTANTVVLNSVAGLPASTPYKVVLNPGESNEEIVKVTAVAGMSLTVVRGWNGTTAVDHAGGATVRHMMTAEDLTLSRTHEDATAAHGATGAVVGTTSAQVLTNKDLSSGTNVFPSTFATKTGVEDLTNKTLVTLNTATPAAIIKSVNGIATDIAQVQDYNGTILVKFANNAFSVGNGLFALYDYAAGVFGASTFTTASSASVRALVVKGAPSQTANLQEWRKSDNTVLGSVDKDGNLTAGSGTFSGAVTGNNIPVVKSSKAGKRFDWQTFTGTTNSTGLVTFNHNLGYIPTTILCTANATSNSNPKGFEPFNVTSTSITARFYTNETGSSYANSSVTANFFFGE
jgi:hypothetical protein